jgi:hypothetical protein
MISKVVLAINSCAFPNPRHEPGSGGERGLVRGDRGSAYWLQNGQSPPGSLGGSGIQLAREGRKLYGGDRQIPEGKVTTLSPAYVSRYCDAGPLLDWADHHQWLMSGWGVNCPGLVRALDRARERGVITLATADRIACELSTHLSVIYGQAYWEMPIHD